MDYHEAVEALFDLRRSGMRPGVDSTRALLSALGDPHEELAVVQIAGSNGKGSTARMVESILREAGVTVGLYTSPHLEDVRERIRVDGRMIPREAIREFVEQVRPLLVERGARGDPVTFFEAVTAMGLWQFARAGADVAVLEVGLGGRHDATSAADPAASAVTNVALEHTDVLGETVGEVAADLAHVAPANAPLVTAATGDALAAIRGVAEDVLTVGEAGAGADVTVAYEGRRNAVESDIALDGAGWSVDTRIPLLGAYQARNAGIAAVLARQVGDVDAASVATGLRSAHWPGRFEVIDREPLVVLDGAHNPRACEAMATTLAEFDYDRLHLVFGAMHEKAHRGMVAALPEPATAVTCEPDLDRAEDSEVLAAVFADAGVDAEAGGAVADAVRRARSRAGPNDCLVVVGSLFCVAEARTAWTRLAVPKSVPDRRAAERVLAAANVAREERDRERDTAVHRVLKTRLQRRQATRLRERARAAGAACAVAGGRTDGQLVDVVLSGTRAALLRLVGDLEADALGLPSVAADLRAGLSRENRARGDTRPGGTAEDGPRSNAADDGENSYPWEDRTAVMGVLNVTPDSFHDGGEFFDQTDAVERARAMVAAGADVIDVGGESTRPGADPVPVDAEIDRVLPVVEAVADTDALVSVDTRKAAVGRAALDAGADVLNDVTGLEDPEMRFLAAERDVPVVVMHSIDAPVDPDRDVAYDDVVEDVLDALRERVLLARKAGVDPRKVIVDPGLGFGKTARESFELLGRLGEFRALGCPVLVGHSHKSMFGLVDRGPDERLPATVAATALAAARGADLVRVHDVAENVAAVRTAAAAQSGWRE